MLARTCFSVFTMVVLLSPTFGQIGDAEAMVVDVERDGYWVRGTSTTATSQVFMPGEPVTAEEPPAPVRMLQLYPSRADRFIYLPGRDELIDVRVSDASGRVVRSFGDMPGRAMLDISSLDPGGYTVTARSGDKFMLGRFTKP